MCTKSKRLSSQQVRSTGQRETGIVNVHFSFNCNEWHQQLTQSDVLIFWGGANDVVKNNCVHGLKNFVNTIQSNNHTNITLLNVSHHFDLMKSSCVNEEISKCNRKLEKLVKHLKHVSLIQLDPNRESFTEHWLYLNSSGKDIISKQLASHILKKLGTEKKKRETK